MRKRIILSFDRYPLKIPHYTNQDYCFRTVQCAIHAGADPIVLTGWFPGLSPHELFGEYEIIRVAGDKERFRKLFQARRLPIFLMGMSRVHLLTAFVGKKVMLYTKWPYFSPNELKKSFQLAVRKKVDKLICLAEWEREEMQRFIPEEKLEWVPSFIDYDFYKETIPRDVARKHFGLKEDDFVVIFCANLREMKGPLGVLEAFSDALQEIPSARLIIAGHNLCSSKTRERMEILLAMEPLRGKVLQTGYLDRERLRLAYAASDCQINNSIAIRGVIYETQCVAVYEGTCQGLAACLPDLRIFREVFPKALFHKNTQELAMNIKRLAKDSELRKAIGLAHQEEMAPYDYHLFDDKMTAILRGFLS